MSEQLFTEYIIHEMRDEGTDGMYQLELAINQRENERRIKAMHNFMRIPNPGTNWSGKNSNKRAKTKLPSLSSVYTKMSDKLRQRLSKDSDTFMECIGQKLLSLAVLHFLPELNERQQQSDKAGNYDLQQVGNSVILYIYIYIQHYEMVM